ncbi:hypothetical protein J6590_030005 [Homalodisca vitripennis]|nr:hypothetical protein J6590_030005 [Homalodisca vitripennis]
MVGGSKLSKRDATRSSQSFGRETWRVTAAGPSAYQRQRKNSRKLNSRRTQRKGEGEDGSLGQPFNDGKYANLTSTGWPRGTLQARSTALGNFG